MTARRFWVRHAADTSGSLLLDAGAVQAVAERRSSLLAAGITEVSGQFAEGDVVELLSPDRGVIARGVVSYDSSELPSMIGRQARRRSGQSVRPVVHADDLVTV